MVTTHLMIKQFYSSTLKEIKLGSRTADDGSQFVGKDLELTLEDGPSPDLHLQGLSQ